LDFSQHIDDLISEDSLTQTLTDMVDIASPTGEEAPLAEYLSAKLISYGVAAQTQKIDDTQSNAFGKTTGQGSEKNLMLYAPIDTVTSNSTAEDTPWIGPELRDDMRAKAYIKDDHIFGLGAHNPKGHGACILETARVLKELNIDLPGDLYFGFGAGGMPTHGRAGFPHNSGHGSGCAKLLASLPKIDSAIIAKSGTSVTWEEVGFIWLEVTVAGKHNYVGARHLMPYDNPIANASKLILKLEDWFEDYSERHASDLCRPQGHIAHMESGWKRMPSFTPEAAQFLIDLRFTPQQNADDVEAELVSAIQSFADELGLSLSTKRVQTIDGSHTSPKTAIIKSTIQVWERLKARPHEAFTVMSGATDANILRQHGIPTARIGLAKAKLPNVDFALGMNCVALSELRHLTKFLTLSVLHYFGKVS